VDDDVSAGDEFARPRRVANVAPKLFHSALQLGVVQSDNVERPDLVSVGEQPSREVESEEARAARDGVPHLWTLQSSWVVTNSGVHEGLREPPVAGVERNGEAVVVRLAGELDLYNAHEVRVALLQEAARGPERLVVDLSEVRFIDSTALGVLIEARTKLPNRRAFLLAAPAVETRRALEISGLDRHFGVHDTLEEALGASV
jgi:anti-sigma B factor antagonist